MVLVLDPIVKVKSSKHWFCNAILHQPKVKNPEVKVKMPKVKVKMHKVKVKIHKVKVKISKVKVDISTVEGLSFNFTQS